MSSRHEICVLWRVSVNVGQDKSGTLPLVPGEKIIETLSALLVKENGNQSVTGIFLDRKRCYKVKFSS